MTRLLLAFLLLVSPTSAAGEAGLRPTEALVIKDDHGGELWRYDFAVRKMEAEASLAASEGRRSRMVVIKGDCGSACTLWLRYPFTCVHPEARLGFHVVRIPEVGANTEWLMAHPEAGAASWAHTEWLMAQYPEKVRKWIQSKGGLQFRYLMLAGQALRDTVMVCSPANLELAKRPPPPAGTAASGAMRLIFDFRLIVFRIYASFSKRSDVAGEP